MSEDYRGKTLRVRRARRDVKHFSSLPAACPRSSLSLEKHTHADDELVLNDFLVDEQRIVLPGAEVVFRIGGVDRVEAPLQPAEVDLEIAETVTQASREEDLSRSSCEPSLLRSSASRGSGR